MRVSIILFLAYLIILNQLTAQEKNIVIPDGITPIIDGNIGSIEWENSVILPLNGGESVYFQKHKDTLYIAVKGKSGGFCSLSIGSQSKFRILHSSTALITAAYEHKNSGWTLIHNFEGPKTNQKEDYPGDTDQWEQEYRKSNFDQFNWYANLVTMGNPTDTEYCIPISELNNNEIYVSIVFYQARAQVRIAKLPGYLSDGTIDRELISGSARNGLDFNPENWIQILGLN